MSKNQLTITELNPCNITVPPALPIRSHTNWVYQYQANPNKEGMLEAVRQVVESQANPQPNLAFGHTSSSEAEVRRYKLVAPGAASDQSVAIKITIAPVSKLEIDICVEVRPPKGQTYLPANLQLMVLNQAGEAVLDAQVGSNNQHIQLEFTGEPGDQFDIKMALGDVSVTESFLIETGAALLLGVGPRDVSTSHATHPGSQV